MEWQEIMNQIVEINDLIKQISLKTNNKIIKEITNRSDKYCDDLSLNLKKLNNAILEHQITITPYQIIILGKINDLNLTTDIETIYQNMPKIKEEAQKYITTLKEKYILANNCLDLVIDIENLSTIEYESSYSFEKSIYARKFQFEEEMFFEYIKDNNIEESDIVIQNNIINKQKQFLNKLTSEEKKDLLIQTLTLSYDRNAFIFINEAISIIKVCNENHYDDSQFIAVSLIHDKYRKVFNYLEQLILIQMPLQNIYNEFKFVYETEIFKQKINKK